MTTVTGCDCTYCERERRDRRVAHVEAARARPVKAEPVAAEPVKTERAPRGLSALRKAFIDWHTNPGKFLDLTSIEPYSDGQVIVKCQSMETVCGIERIGSGAYSIVYAIDDKRVIKVVRGTDSGYARFIDAVRRNRNNPHLPKVYYSGVWAGKTIYILERLTERPETPMPGRYGDCKANEYFRAAITQRPSENPFIRLASRYLEQVANLLREINTRGGLDLHSANVMFRGDVPVVTDPCAD